MKTHILWLGISLFLFSVSCNSYEEDDYANYRKAIEHISGLYESLIEKYDFARFNFDHESIFNAEAPALLLSTLLDSVSPFETKIVNSTISDDGMWYEVDFTVDGNPYLFRTETKSEWVNIDSLGQVFCEITQDLSPKDTFVFPSWDAEQASDVLFGPKEDFFAALAEGLPIDNPSIRWGVEGKIVPDAYYFHLAVERPDDETVKTLLLEGLVDLDRRGYKVPQLNANRVYVTDLFKEDKICLIIDGDYLISDNIKAERKKLIFSNSGYLPVLLWKMMQSRPESEVRVPIEGKADVILTQAEFEKAFFARLPRK